jgi:ribosomal protein L11 methylase PrmA
MTSACRKYCLEAIQLSETLIQLAHDGNASCDDDRCLVLFGIILDSASHVRREAVKRLRQREVEEPFEKSLDC